MNVEELLERLEHVKPSGAGWIARCPAHEDRTPSLSINIGERGIVMKCHAGCDNREVCAALGISLGDLMDRTNGAKPKAPRPSTAVPKLNFTDAEIAHRAEELAAQWREGGPVAEWLKTRGITAEVSARLRWGVTERAFPKAGISPAVVIPHYQDGRLVGVKYRAVPKKDHIQEPGSSTTGLYGEADPEANEILVLEGPPDVALALSHGFNAVGLNAADASTTKDDLELLGGYRSVFLIGDGDLPGKRAMDKLELSLKPDHPEPVIRVRLSYKDIGDLYAADPPNFRAALTAILRCARAGREYFEPEDLLTETELRACAAVREPFAIHTLVPRGRITMLFGEEKSGKSLLATYAGKCVMNGVFVFGKYPTTKMPVLLLDLENIHADLEDTVAWFGRVGPAEITYRTRVTGCPALDSPGLLRYCERQHPLLILDSLTKFAGQFFLAQRGGKGSSFNPDDMSLLFDKLLDLCAADATIIIIHHCTRDEIERYANSYVIGASIARAFAVVSEDKPRFHRIRLEGVLFRGAEPVSERLIAFPVIAEHGMFGLDAGGETEIDRVVALFEKEGAPTTRETVKKKMRGNRSRITQLIKTAISEGRLVELEDGRVGVPKPRNAPEQSPRSQDAEQSGTLYDENTFIPVS
jgi:putative DNA primase/helicase